MFPQNPPYAEQTNAVTTSADPNHPSAIFAQHSCAGPSITDTLSAVQCITRPLPAVLSSCICQKRSPDPEAMWSIMVTARCCSSKHFWAALNSQNSRVQHRGELWELGIFPALTSGEMETWPKHHFYLGKNAGFMSFFDLPQLIIMKNSIWAFLSHITFLQNRIASVSMRKAVPGLVHSED